MRGPSTRVFLLAAAVVVSGCSSSGDDPSSGGASGSTGTGSIVEQQGADATGGVTTGSGGATGGGGASGGDHGGSVGTGNGGAHGGADAAGGAAGHGGSPDGGSHDSHDTIDGGLGDAYASSDGRHAAGARIACVGDSITVGLGSTDQGKKSYPADLAVLLGTSFVVENDGHSGATMMKNEVFGGSYWSTSEFTRAHAFMPDIVIITLGTNDMNIYDWDHHDQFAGDYAAMVDDFRSLASHPDVYVGLPPWVMTDKPEVGLTEDRMSNVIIPAIRGVAASKATPIIDFHAVTQNHPDYYHDEIHPNDVGYAAMATAEKTAPSK